MARTQVLLASSEMDERTALLRTPSEVSARRQRRISWKQSISSFASFKDTSREPSLYDGEASFSALAGSSIGVRSHTIE
jgi:hypothetical protein